MNIEDLRRYCLKKRGAWESFPFDKDTLVMKVGSKMFALINLESALGINLKCDPEKAIHLREMYPSVVPGFHMNKMHWNTVNIDGNLNNKLIYEWIDHSYELVFNNLTRKEKDKLMSSE